MAASGEPEAPSLSGPAGRGRHYGFVIVVVGLLVVLGVQGFLRFGYAMMLPGMRDALGIDFTQTGLLATVNYIGYMLGAAFVGPAVDRFGSRRTIAGAALTTALAVLFTAIVSSYPVALALQFVAGVGSVLALSPTLSLTAFWFAPRYRGRAAGVITSGGPLGSVVTGPLMPLLIALFGASAWRYGWAILGAAIVLFAVLAWLFLRDRPEEKGMGPYGETNQAPLKLGRVNRRLAYTTPLVWYVAGLGLLSTLQAVSFNTFFTLYLTQERGLSTADAGSLWALAGVVGIISGFIWGGVSDKVGRKYALLSVYLLQAACFALFALGGHPLVFVFCAFLYGSTARANLAIMAAFSGDMLGPQLAAAAFSINNALAGIGLAVGPLLAGWLADTTGSFGGAFWVSAGVALLGALGTALLRNRRTGEAVAASKA